MLPSLEVFTNHHPIQVGVPMMMGQEFINLNDFEPLVFCNYQIIWPLKMATYYDII